MDDSIRAYGEESTDHLSVTIIKFETDYVEREVDGKVKQFPRDIVELGKVGDPAYRQIYSISRLSGPKSDSPRIWAAIRPDYENWKKGEQVVHDGMPLAAVAFVPKRAVEMYRMANIHTVEQLASVEDAALPRLGMDARKHRDMAQKYVEGATGDAAKIKALEARLAELEGAKTQKKGVAA